MQNPQKSLGMGKSKRTKMGKSNKEDLSQSLILHPNAIQFLDQTASLTVEQLKWQQVIQMSDHLSKQATIVGMLWNEESPKAESLKETIESYFISLQGFLLCCHKIAVAAGPTLSSLIHVSVKQIVDSSFELSKGSVSLYEGTYEKDKKPYIPKLTAVVLEAWFNFKKVPSTNLIAIGNAISQVAVIMKDVLNKMKDVKRPACPSRECDDFSPEQIEFAKLVADIVSEAIMVVIVIRVMTKKIGMENPKEDSEFVDSLEKVLKLCQRSGVEIEKLGTCVYHQPPLEIDKMVQTVKILGENLDEVEAEVEHKKWSSNAFPGVCRKLRDAIKLMEVGMEKRKDLNHIMIAHQNTIYNTLQAFSLAALERRQEFEKEYKKMVKSKKEDLNQFLISHLNTIYDTLQLFDRTASSTVEKVNWNDVLQMSDHLSKQATIVGMLWTGESPKAESLKETMESYFNALQGFLLCCHGSTVGAGPTLSSIIHVSVKQIVDSSFRLLQGSVSLYEGSYEKDKKPSIPQLSGVVWEACSSFKKVPATNITAIGRAITQVAVSMKDVLREMKEVKPAECEASGASMSGDDDDDDDDLGDDLSPEEMEVATMVGEIVSETITVIKELIRVITSMIKLENPKDNSGFVESLEKLLKLCKGTGVQIDELGACVYPPQEIDKMKQTVKIIQGNLNEVEAEVKCLKSSSDGFTGACGKLRNSLKHMETELDKRSKAELVVEMQNVTLGN